MIELLLVILLVILAILYIQSQRKLRELAFEKKSLSVKYGKMSEQFFPFLASYAHKPENFRFLGTPIDGVQFDENKIVFVEFKTGDSRLSERQRRIKSLVEKKKIEFEEIKIK